MPRTLLHTFDDTLAPSEVRTLTYLSPVHATVREVRCKSDPREIYVTRIAAGLDAMTMGSPIALSLFVPAPNAVNDSLEGDVTPTRLLSVGLHNEGQQATRVQLEVWGDEHEGCHAS